MTKPFHREIGKCIYCGTTSGKLTDEHVIPYGLNGITILRNASCLKCNEITSAIERKCLKGFAWHMRIALGFKTRRPKKIPKTFPLGIEKNGKESIIHVPIGDHFVVLPLPMYFGPYFLRQVGLENAPGVMLSFHEKSKNGLYMNGFQTVWFVDPEKVRNRFKADGIFVEGWVDTLAFAQMLAKIAYGLFVAKHGPDALEENYMLPIIFGETQTVGLYIGSTNDVLAPLPEGESNSNIWHFSKEGDTDFVMVLMHLFPFTHALGYLAIVGRPKPVAT